MSSEHAAVEISSAKTVDEKIALITRGLEEVMGGEKSIAAMRSILEQRDLKIYWGTATTGAPHIAYFVPMTKIADFLRAGCEVTILFADLHAYLDNQKAPWDLLMARADYYEAVIKAMLTSIGVPIEKLSFVRGTSYQLGRDFSLDVYKLSALTTERNSKKAGAEVVKQVESPLLSGMLYPLLQALDEEYLKCDAQFGGVDQRKIFTYAETYLPRIGYKKRIHLMNPMIPSFSGGKGNKMSASEGNTKIDLLEPAEEVLSKIKKAFAEPGVVEGNGLLSFTQRVVFPLSKDGKFVIERQEKHGGNLVFSSFEELQEAYANQTLFPLDLKNALAVAINDLLEPIRQIFKSSEMQEIIARAYPAHIPEHQAVVEEEEEEEDEVIEEPKVAAEPSGEFYKLDFRAAKLISVEDHPEADTLYVCKADIGEAEPIQVVTNLKKSMTIDELQNRLVVLLCNMKPTSFRGQKSLAMLLGGGSADGAAHELVAPAVTAKAGERLFLKGQKAVEGVIARANEKVIASVFGQLSTNKSKVLTWDGNPITTAAGPVISPNISNAVYHSK